MKIRDMIIKDLKIALSDRSAIALLLIMPMVLMGILGFSLTLAFDDEPSLEKVKIAIVKEYDYQKEVDGLLELMSANSETDSADIELGDFNLEDIFFEEFLGNEDLQDIIEYEILDRNEAVQKLNSKDITAMVIIPKGFIKDTMINFGTSFRNVVKINVIGRTDKNIGTTIVEEVMRGFTDMLNYNISAKNSITRLYSSLEIKDDIEEHIEPLTDKIQYVLATERPEVEYEPLNNRSPMNSRAYYAFAMTAMFTLFSAGYGSKLLLEERDMKTYDRMSASGVKQSTIVIGKAATIFFIILVQLIISYIFSTLVLRVDWGNILNLLLIFIASAFCISGFGIMLATIVFKSESYNLGNVFTSFIVQIMSVLGGSMMPLENLPSFARVVSNFMPNGLILKAFMKNYYGYGLEESALYLVALFIMGLLFMIIATVILMKGRRGNHVKHFAIKADAA